MYFVTDCDYCGNISSCFEDEGRGTCCLACADKHNIKPLKDPAKCHNCQAELLDDMEQAAAMCVNCMAFEDYDDGQPTEYEEWQDVYGGDDWDHGQFDIHEDF